jgi:hypothetical protein
MIKAADIAERSIDWPVLGNIMGRDNVMTRLFGVLYKYLRQPVAVVARRNESYEQRGKGKLYDKTTSTYLCDCLRQPGVCRERSFG